MCAVVRRSESRSSVPKAKLVIAAIILSAAVPQRTIADLPPIHHRHPVTIERLTAFMDEHRFAKPYLVREIVQTADTNRIPASLLVCIEFLESSGGRHYHSPENRFGWDNGKASFASHSAAIRFVAIQLGSGRYYAGKSLADKIRTYNPRPIYTQKTLGCMKEIDQQPTLVAGIE
jgi:hypothetical protein